MGDSCKPVKTPAPEKQILIKATEEDEIIHKNYRQMVGCLQYLTCLTRPDIANAVREVAQQSNAPTKEHHQAVKRIFRYLRGTTSHGIEYGGVTAEKAGRLFAYVDAAYAEDVNTRRSTTGFVIFMNGGPIAWGSKRQSIVTYSSTEAEYVAITPCLKNLLTLRRILEQVCPQKEPTVIFEDNESAKTIAESDAVTSRTKHIDVRYHAIREQIAKETVRIKHIGTKDQLADPLTKNLGPTLFVKHRGFIVKMPSVEKTST